MTKNVRIAKELVKLAKSLMVTAATGDAAGDGDGEEGNGYVPQNSESDVKKEIEGLINQAKDFEDAGKQMAQSVTEMSKQVQDIQEQVQKQVQRSLRIASRRGVNASDIANSIREFKIASIDFVDNCKSYSSALNKHRIACRRARQAGVLGDALKGIGNMFTKVKDDVLDRLRKNPKVQKEVQEVKESGEEVGENLAKLIASAKIFITKLLKGILFLVLGPIGLVVWAIRGIQKLIHAMGVGIAECLEDGREEFIKLWGELNKWIDKTTKLCITEAVKAEKAIKEGAKNVARDIMKALYDALIKTGAEVTRIIQDILAFFEGVHKGYKQYNEKLKQLADNKE